MDAIRDTGVKTKFYQASTSELYGLVQEVPQTEKTPFYHRSPYAAAKLYSYWITVNYREAYKLFTCNGILFNYESERRGKTFVKRKISVGVSKIMLWIQDKLLMGNIDSKRDWGYTPEYVEGMWRILQAPEPDDFVLAINETHTVKEFIKESFKILGEEITWEGTGINERGLLKSFDHEVIAIDPRYFRPTEVELLIGDYSKVKKKLGWEPKTIFSDLVKLMVKADWEKIKNRIEQG